MINTSTWREHYRRVLGSWDDAAKGIRSGDNILSGFVSNTPSTEMYDAITRRVDRGEIDNIRYYDGFRVKPNPLLDPEFLTRYDGHITYTNCYGNVGPSKAIYRSKTSDFFPCNSPDYPDKMTRLCDVFMIAVTPPNEKGYCSIGPVNFFSLDVIRKGRASGKLRYLVGELNPNLPVVYGDNWVHISEFDAVVEHESPLVCVPRGPASATEEAIGQYCLEIIQDGDTVQMGIGGIAEFVANGLTVKHDIGIMSEAMPSAIKDLMDSGAVTNLKKPFYTGKTVTSICVGDQELYDFINENPDVWVGPSSVTCDIAFVMQHPNMIAINAALMVDLSSQAACEGVGHMMISGSGGQLEFVVGSHYAQNGRSLTVLPAASMRNGQLVSNIVPDFEPGTPVTVPRTYVDYVVTEYGIARMRDKTRIERAKALIEIAHPDFRGELRDSMKSFFYPKHWADRD